MCWLPTTMSTYRSGSYESGAAVELAVTGRRVAEAEFDLMLLLPQKDKKWKDE